MITESAESHLQSQFELSIHIRRTGGTSAAVLGTPGGAWLSTAPAHDGTSVHPEDRFLTYSLTKTLIACAIMKLQESGSIALDDCLAQWLPDLPFAYQITVRQLLNHTSGLPDYGGTEAYQQSLKNAPQEPWTEEEFLRYTCGGRLRSTPGTTFFYSNIGYMYLRILLQTIHTGTLGEILEEQIFQPLAMKSSRVQTRLADQDILLPSYSRYIGSGDPVDVRTVYHPGWVAHGVVASTAADMAAFFHALFNPEEPLLTSDSVMEMRKLRRVNESHRYFRNPGYGLGLMGEERRTGSIYGHTGSGPGFAAAAYVLHDPYGDPVTAVVLCNSESSEQAEGIALDLLNVARSV